MNHEQVVKGKVFSIQRYSIHDGPGIRTIVFLQGCSLRCLWCSNPESHYVDHSSLISVDDVLAEILKDQIFYSTSHGGITLSGGEASLQFEFCYQLLKKCKEYGVSGVLETAGYVPEKKLLKLAELCEVILFDVKHLDSEKHANQTGVRNDIILHNLKRLVEEKIQIIIRIPVIPNFNANSKDLQNIFSYLEILQPQNNYQSIQHIELLPFHQYGKSKYEKLKIPYSLSNEKFLKSADLQNLISNISTFFKIKIIDS